MPEILDMGVYPPGIYSEWPCWLRLGVMLKGDYEQIPSGALCSKRISGEASWFLNAPKGSQFVSMLGSETPHAEGLHTAGAVPPILFVWTDPTYIRVMKQKL
ncbi:hypothetical protein PM082_003666 [Marasmius tenuissimus]|nr:hypothetical protein PM082_003666 [Marasmius tenuissimus]